MKAAPNLLSIMFQKSCPLFQNHPTGIKGRIAALSPNSPFLGCFHFIFAVFAVWTTFRQLFTNVFFSGNGFRTDLEVDSGFQNLVDSGFQINVDSGFQSTGFRIPTSKICWIPDSGFCYTRRDWCAFKRIRRLIKWKFFFFVGHLAAGRSS